MEREGVRGAREHGAAEDRRSPAVDLGQRIERGTVLDPGRPEPCRGLGDRDRLAAGGGPALDRLRIGRARGRWPEPAGRVEGP